MNEFQGHDVNSRMKVFGQKLMEKKTATLGPRPFVFMLAMKGEKCVILEWILEMLTANRNVDQSVICLANASILKFLRPGHQTKVVVLLLKFSDRHVGWQGDFVGIEYLHGHDGQLFEGRLEKMEVMQRHGLKIILRNSNLEDKFFTATTNVGRRLLDTQMEKITFLSVDKVRLHFQVGQTISLFQLAEILDRLVSL